jgi:hypothetical protein
VPWQQMAFGKSLFTNGWVTQPRDNLFSLCSVDGNHLQHPAGDCHPYGILCLQAYSSSVTAKQVLLQIFWEQDKLCCTQVNGEVGMQTFLLGNDLWSGQLVNAK